MSKLKTITIPEFGEYVQQQKEINTLFTEVRNAYISKTRLIYLKRFLLAVGVAIFSSLLVRYLSQDPNHSDGLIMGILSVSWISIVLLLHDFSPIVTVNTKDKGVQKLLEYFLHSSGQKLFVAKELRAVCRLNIFYSHNDNYITINDAQEIDFLVIYPKSMICQSVSHGKALTLFQTATLLDKQITEKFGRTGWFWESENTIGIYETPGDFCKKTVYLVTQ